MDQYYDARRGMPPDRPPSQINQVRERKAQAERIAKQYGLVAEVLHEVNELQAATECDDPVIFRRAALRIVATLALATAETQEVGR